MFLDKVFKNGKNGSKTKVKPVLEQMVDEGLLTKEQAAEIGALPTEIKNGDTTGVHAMKSSERQIDSMKKSMTGLDSIINLSEQLQQGMQSRRKTFAK